MRGDRLQHYDITSRSRGASLAKSIHPVRRIALALAVVTGFSVAWTESAEARKGRRVARVEAKQRRPPVRTAASSRRPARPDRVVKPRRIVSPSGNPLAALPRARTQRARIVFGVMGGAGENAPEVDAKLEVIGARIARRGHVTLTGACLGLPESAARGARAEGGLTVGISSYSTLEDHIASGSPTDFDVMQLTELPLAHRGQDRPNYMGREIDNIERSDVIIVAGGRFGTLGELAIALEEQRPIGVLTGTGGIADIVKEIVAASTSAGKPPGAPVIYDSNPARLVARLEQAHRNLEKSGGRRRGPLGDDFRVRK
jgi:predicted Rossmann-fold nucleotide-binding protein